MNVRKYFNEIDQLQQNYFNKIDEYNLNFKKDFIVDLKYNNKIHDNRNETRLIYKYYYKPFKKSSKYLINSKGKTNSNIIKQGLYDCSSDKVKNKIKDFNKLDDKNVNKIVDLKEEFYKKFKGLYKIFKWKYSFLDKLLYVLFFMTIAPALVLLLRFYIMKFLSSEFATVIYSFVMMNNKVLIFIYYLLIILTALVSQKIKNNAIKKLNEEYLILYNYNDKLNKLLLSVENEITYLYLNQYLDEIESQYKDSLTKIRNSYDYIEFYDKIDMYRSHLNEEDKERFINEIVNKNIDKIEDLNKLFDNYLDNMNVRNAFRGGE